MGKSQQHAMQRKQRPGVMPARKRVPPSTPSKATVKPRPAQNEAALPEQLETIFAFLPDSVVACDQDGKILRLNDAALKLFEVPSEAWYSGNDYYEFFERYKFCNEQQQPITLEPWLQGPCGNESVTSLPSARGNCSAPGSFWAKKCVESHLLTGT